MCTSPRPPRTAVFGCGGTVGRALGAAYRSFDPATLLLGRRTTPLAFDLADFASPGAKLSSELMEALRQCGATHAVIAAGVTKIAACEADPQGTRRVNVDGTLGLAAALSALGLTVIWFSTDYVFDGLANAYPDEAATAPLNEYGRQKAEVEARLPDVCGGNCLVLRLGKVYGTTPGDGSLLDEMAASLLEGREVRAARDQIFCQVHVDDMTSAVLALQAAKLRGVCNLCAPGCQSRLDIARLVARSLGLPESLVRPISLDDLGEAFTRPKRVDLVPRRLAALPKISFRSLDTAIQDLARAYADRGAT